MYYPIYFIEIDHFLMHKRQFKHVPTTSVLFLNELVYTTVYHCLCKI